MTAISIRAATAADLGAIEAIQARSPEASQWTADSYLGYDCRVASVADAVAGFLAIRDTAPGEREILNLAVDPEFRRQGVGKALLAQALASGGDWFLEVRESNRGAISLYRKLGFRVVGTRSGYYHSPGESGIVMKYGS